MADAPVLRIFTIIAMVIAAACIVADQLQRKQMTRGKWGIATLLFTVLIGNTWTGATP